MRFGKKHKMWTISCRAEYERYLSKGADPMARPYMFEIDHKLRTILQGERFGGNDAEGNEKFYKFCLFYKPMVCEECGKPITHPSATNVSHILTRGAHPEMAHDFRNINILCFEHHQMWEHATTRTKMRIYKKNQQTIEKLMEEYQNDIKQL